MQYEYSAIRGLDAKECAAAVGNCGSTMRRQMQSEGGEGGHTQKVDYPVKKITSQNLCPNQLIN